MAWRGGERGAGAGPDTSLPQGTAEGSQMTKL